MLEIKKKVEKFLRKYGMYFGSIDLEDNCQVFMSEMKNGLYGIKSSLKMIPTYISMEKEIPVQEPVIVMDAGGTNFRVAVVTFDNERKPVIEDFKLYPMPGTNGKTTKDEFFQTIAQYMEPVLGKSNKIGFCFSYPTEILPNGDGRLIQFCKEVQVEGVEGELIGENLLNTVKKLGNKEDKKVVMLNDTVATLLGGRASFPDRVFDSYIGFILGTGTNICYIEENSNIKVLPEVFVKEGSMLINVESGAYGKAPMGHIDVSMDRATVNPGQYVFEKMIAGGYQGSLMLAVIKKAVLDGLFSEAFEEKITNISDLISKDIDDFLNFPYSDKNPLARCCSAGDTIKITTDCQTLYYLIDAMMERAAKLVAVNIASVIIKTGKGGNPCLPVCITAEGTTFYKSKLVRNKLEFYLKKYLNERKNLYCEFVKVENATLIGTAIAGLMI